MVGKYKILVQDWSDGLCSSVENPPVFVVSKAVLSDSQTILLASDMLFPVQLSVFGHSRFDHEFDTILIFVLRED